MAEIQIKIETYGAIERQLPKDLNFSCVENSMVLEILQQVSDQYPECSSLLEKCACAIGDEIIPRRYRLTNHCTLVLLSPVAGG